MKGFRMIARLFVGGLLGTLLMLFSGCTEYKVAVEKEQRAARSEEIRAAIEDIASARDAGDDAKTNEGVARLYQLHEDNTGRFWKGVASTLDDAILDMKTPQSKDEIKCQDPRLWAALLITMRDHPEIMRSQMTILDSIAARVKLLDDEELTAIYREFIELFTNSRR